MDAGNCSLAGGGKEAGKAGWAPERGKGGKIERACKGPGRQVAPETLQCPSKAAWPTGVSPRKARGNPGEP